MNKSSLIANIIFLSEELKIDKAESIMKLYTREELEKFNATQLHKVYANLLSIIAKLEANKYLLNIYDVMNFKI